MHLPDEILSLILSPALTVPDRDFASTAPVSPFATYSESASAYLLVCKSWLRVATPLLYHVVVVRSKAQAATLARALLQKDLNLGRFVKKLRLEGAYGAPLLTVLKNTPNLTDLCLSLTIYAVDNVAGLCTGLPLVNPTRLILQRPDGRPNKNKTALMSALVACIPSWTHLTVFDASAFSGLDTRTITPLFMALSAAQRLKTVSVCSIPMVDTIYSLLEGCPLAAIHPVSRQHISKLALKVKNETARALVKFEEKEQPFTARQLFLSLDQKVVPTIPTPFLPPNQNVPDAIFDLILHFAMTGATMSIWRKRPSRLPFLLVSINRRPVAAADLAFDFVILILFAVELGCIALLIPLSELGTGRSIDIQLPIVFHLHNRSLSSPHQPCHVFAWYGELLHAAEQAAREIGLENLMLRFGLVLAHCAPMAT
ncbi:hypothetical protein HMN09_01060200 [Mycena chlorophos]|uniref:F-box domain-containing protein n=1 Tax=Mycena chlorophos TaxID=658473 RepID=A0A8H6SBT8_MYCCL|nr:hypothetical protein HMN09_01060200 [Mycena chlorophos]